MVDNVGYVGDTPSENLSTTDSKALVGYVVDTPTRARDNDGYGTTLRSGKPAHDNGLAPTSPIVMASAYVPISIAAVRAFQAV